MIEQPDIFQPEITPVMLLEAIDEKFKELKGKKDRLSLEWGHFSRGMNLEIRKYCSNLPEASLLRQQYNYVMMYWTSKSRLLDLHMRHKLLGQGKIRREKKTAETLKEMILSNKQLIPTTDRDLFRETLRR